MIGAALANRAAIEPEARARLMRRATYASVGVASVLIAAKLAAWLITDSVGVLSSLVDSLLDAAASLVNLLAVRHALMPPDREHRFGHGKAEPLAGLAQSAFVTGSAAFLLVEAARRLIEPKPIPHTGIGVAVMVVSIGLTFALVLYQRHVIRSTGSTAIHADALHYTGDLLVNGGVIVTLLMAQWLALPVLDPVFGACVAAYIVYSAWRIARLSLDMLMDREMPDEDRARIRDVCLAHPEVRAVHDLRTRLSGHVAFIQVHIEMDGGMTLLRAHAVSDEIEARLAGAFPGAEVLIHQDPAGIVERRADLVH